MTPRPLVFVFSLLLLGFSDSVWGELGIAIDHSPASSERYIGSPSLALLPDGGYVASHDFFGKGTEYRETHIFVSEDRGQTWNRIAELEGNIVVGPSGELRNLLRLDTEAGGKAVSLLVSEDGRTIGLDPSGSFIDLPGGCKKFTIRKDEETGNYYALTNWIHPFDAGGNPERTRNTVALVSSRDLKNWRLESIVLRDPDVAKVAHQYIDWQFEGDDIVYVSRTAYDDGEGGAHRPHDANYLTFHRLESFREIQSLYRAIPEALPLWSGVKPGNIELEGPEARNGCGISNISNPTLSVFLPKEPNGAAVLIVPGGGYGNVCVNVEGTPQIDGLLKQGFAAFVLKYRLPNGDRDVPVWDGRRALQMIRHNAGDWGIDPTRVGVWGFSAGGHLASSLSTGVGNRYPAPLDAISFESDLPNFSILFYPVISMEDSIVHKGSRRNLLGTDEPNDEEIREYSTHLRVSSETPPSYLVHCKDDQVVPIANSETYFESLQRNGVSSELHVYEKGGHGIGVMNTNPEWESELNAWLAKR